MKASRFDLHLTELETTCFCEGKHKTMEQPVNFLNIKLFI